MNIHALYNRYDLITRALQICRNAAYFTTGQKICLHQERAALMHAIDDINAGADHAEPGYRIHPTLDMILKRIQLDYKLL